MVGQGDDAPEGEVKEETENKTPDRGLLSVDAYDPCRHEFPISKKKGRIFGDYGLG